MVYFLKVAARNRKTGKVTTYDYVYDIGHYYGYNVSTKLESSAIRLLIKEDPASPGAPQREYINLLENDVAITLQDNNIPKLRV